MFRMVRTGKRTRLPLKTLQKFMNFNNNSTLKVSLNIIRWNPEGL